MGRAVTIDWAAFTPVHAAFGGALIGLAASVFILGAGRIAGISGIAAGLTQGPDRLWRAAFLIGLVVSPLLLHGLPSSLDLSFRNPPLLVIGGLLVGGGTRLANGCTSGHGVCGLSRRSTRSLAATCTFMLFGIVTVWVIRHGVSS